jgi:uncharacterized RDD family membrane protein YckC
MSNTPERDGPTQWDSSQGARPGEPVSPGTQQGTVPGQSGTGQAGYARGSLRGSDSPVSEMETRVTGRRVVQYLIDAFLVGLIPSLVSIPFDRSSRTSIHVIGGIVAFALFVLIGLWYWVIRAHGKNGQTFGMQLLGLRVISKDGGPANMAQLFIRWICLIFDAIPYSWPFTGLVGFVVILASRRRQRIGDHVAKTLVISTGALSRRGYGGSGMSGSAGRPEEFAGQGQPSQPGSYGPPGS